MADAMERLKSKSKGLFLGIFDEFKFEFSALTTIINEVDFVGLGRTIGEKIRAGVRELLSFELSDFVPQGLQSTFAGLGVANQAAATAGGGQTQQASTNFGPLIRVLQEAIGVGE